MEMSRFAKLKSSREQTLISVQSGRKRQSMDDGQLTTKGDAMDCIFCKIIQGKIPSVKIYEDDKVFAFMDINPLSTGHTLVVPKTHAADIFEISEQDTIEVIRVVRLLSTAIKKGVQADGINILQLNGKAAGQVVPHLHVHIIPRWFDDGITISHWPMKAGDMDKLKEIAEKIKAEV